MHRRVGPVRPAGRPRADALYRVGDLSRGRTDGEPRAEYAIESELLMELQWTLAQSRIRAGSFAEALATLDRALASPGISARHRARLLVLAARTHSNYGEVEKAGLAATRALTAATEAGDDWAMGWSLLMLALETSVQGQPDRRAVAVRPGAGSDPGRPRPGRPAPAAADQPGGDARLTSTATRKPWPQPGSHGNSRARSARQSGSRRRTAP